MTFGQDVSLQCLSIIATGDNERERNKTLVLVLTSTDRSINLQPVAATVTIIPTKSESGTGRVQFVYSLVHYKK